MKAPTGYPVDSAALPLIQAGISFIDQTTSAGAANGLTVVDTNLDNGYVGQTVKLLTGTAAGQVRAISSYTQGTGTLTVATAFTNAAGAAITVAAGTFFIIGGMAGGSSSSGMAPSAFASGTTGVATTFTNGTGTCTGSPITLPIGTTTIAVTVLGNFTCVMPAGSSCVISSGTCTVTGSPVTCTVGSNTITTTTATGNITALVTGVEADLSDPNVVGSFELIIDTVNLAAVDVLELRVYKMVLTGGTAPVLYETAYYGAQPADDTIKHSPLVTNDISDATAVRFTFKQTFGTQRALPWKVFQHNT